MYGLVLAHNDDAVINQFCSIFVPIYWGYIAILYLVGPKIQQKLIQTDDYREKKIRIRAYSFLRSAIPLLFFGFAAVYFLIHHSYSVSFIMAFVFLGYSWIRFDGTYCIQIHYTKRKMRYRTWKKSTTIPFSAVSKMAWETGRHSLGYILVIYCNDGTKIYLSSADFVGLNKLKETYEKVHML